MQNQMRVTAALIITYAILGLLMNSVGTVILQSISQFGITKAHASSLEACKDLSVVVASFLFAASLPKFGFRRAEMVVMAIIGVACLLIPQASAFWANQLMFVVIGLCFGVAKVATYSSIGLLRPDPGGHASLTSLIEGCFMVAILIGIWMFGWFIGQAESGGGSWLRVYYVIAAMCAAAIMVWSTAKLDESGAMADGVPGSQMDMLRLAMLPAVIAFLLSIFIYVLIEQGIGSWLPTFNNEILHLPAAMSVQASSIFVAALAIGRLGASGLVKKLGWLRLLLGCLVAMALLVILTLPATNGLKAGTITSWADVPWVAYIFPLIGVFMAPIYPIVCSVMLSALPREKHAAMVGLMVIFSALGGTIGSFLTGFTFERLSGQTAFYLTLVPIALLFVTLILFKRRIEAGPLTHDKVDLPGTDRA